MDTPLKMKECDLNDADNMDSGHAIQGFEEAKSTEIKREPCKSSEIKDCSNNGTDANVSDKDVQKSNPEDDELEGNNSIGKKQSTVLDSDTKDESISTEKLEDCDLNKETDSDSMNNTLEDKDIPGDTQKDDYTYKKRLIKLGILEQELIQTQEEIGEILLRIISLDIEIEETRFKQMSDEYRAIAFEYIFENMRRQPKNIGKNWGSRWATERADECRLLARQAEYEIERLCCSLEQEERKCDELGEKIYKLLLDIDSIDCQK